MAERIEKREFFTIGRAEAANLADDFANLLGGFSADAEKIGEIVADLLAKYSESHRAYHNLSHVGALLFHAEKFRESFADYDAVRLAVWFHDAIYDPPSSTNERDSARLAVEGLTRLNFPGAVIEKVEKMILATEKHDAGAPDADRRLLLDLDLGILGADEGLYREYARAIRREYSFAPEDLYRRGRRAVLQSFLRREFIYYTGEMRESLERRARRNIANEIKELS